MTKNVLIVDDDQEMLLSLSEGLGKYDEIFSVLIAGDGVIALEKLRAHSVSLVVTDLKMPGMDGFTLLGHIIEHYPDIPVIIMTGYSTPEMQDLAHGGGAVGYIEKPFMVEDLARKIMATMKRESEGGTLHGVSSGMFLQLIEMEQKTCTIRLVDRKSDTKGVLFFKEGELLDARVGDMQGLEAAYEVFSWDEVTLSIQNLCVQKEKRIEGDLQGILLEAMRLKDESAQSENSAETPLDQELSNGRHTGERPEAADPLDLMVNRVKKELGERSIGYDIYQDNSWDGVMGQMEKIGEILQAGRLKLAYIDRAESSDFILLPGAKTKVIAVDPKCPKDRVIGSLSD